jgi:hypothetical protein
MTGRWMTGKYRAVGKNIDGRKMGKKCFHFLASVGLCCRLLRPDQLTGKWMTGKSGEVCEAGKYEIALCSFSCPQYSCRCSIFMSSIFLSLLLLGVLR